MTHIVSEQQLNELVARNLLDMFSKGKIVAMKAGEQLNPDGPCWEADIAETVPNTYNFGCMIRLLFRSDHDNNHLVFVMPGQGTNRP